MSTEAEWTDIGLSLFFSGPPSDFPDGDPALPNNLRFTFDFRVASVAPGGRLYFRRLWTDVSTDDDAILRFTFASGATQEVSFLPMNGAEIGGLPTARAHPPTEP